MSGRQAGHAGPIRGHVDERDGAVGIEERGGIRPRSRNLRETVKPKLGLVCGVLSFVPRADKSRGVGNARSLVGHSFSFFFLPLLFFSFSLVTPWSARNGMEIEYPLLPFKLETFAKVSKLLRKSETTENIFETSSDSDSKPKIGETEKTERALNVHKMIALL